MTEWPCGEEMPAGQSGWAPGPTCPMCPAFPPLRVPDPALHTSFLATQEAKAGAEAAQGDRPSDMFTVCPGQGPAACRVHLEEDRRIRDETHGHMTHMCIHHTHTTRTHHTQKLHVSPHTYMLHTHMAHLHTQTHIPCHTHTHTRTHAHSHGTEPQAAPGPGRLSSALLVALGLQSRELGMCGWDAGQ